MLNLLSKKCGLGNDRYQFEAGGVKTATEVISEKSDLYQNLRKHELLLGPAIVDMVKALPFWTARRNRMRKYLSTTALSTTTTQSSIITLN